MTISFLPGEPNRSPQCCSFVSWNLIQILAFCSGNNLVILTKNYEHLQTIYLDTDSFVVDINKVNGKIAIALQNNKVLIYTPAVSNFYNFNFNGRRNIFDLKIHWDLEIEIENKRDDSKINCICWSDSCEIREDELDSNQFFGLPDEYNSETSCELVSGSDKSLTLWRFYYKNDINGTKKIHKKTLWFQKQPNPIYMVKFSPNSTSIASVGYYDKLVKIWHRVSFGIESSDFQLSYIPHPTYVTSIRWKSIPKIMKTTNDPSGAATPNRNTSFDHSDYLKPSNNLIKTSIPKNLGLVSETASIVSISANTRQHNVLYTVASDSILRVYTTFNLDKGFQLFNPGSLDLYDGQLNSDSKKFEKNKKFASILDNDLVDYGLSKLISELDVLIDEFEMDGVETDREIDGSGFNSDEDQKKKTLRLRYLEKKRDNLLTLQMSKPEICFVFDSEANINLFALTNLCSPVPRQMSTFRLNEMLNGDDQGHKNDPSLSSLVKIKCGVNCVPKEVRDLSIHDFLITYYKDDIDISFVIHDLFKNSVKDIGFSFDELFKFGRENNDDRAIAASLNPYSSIKGRNPISIGKLQQKFTGHNKSIRKLIRSTDGSAVLSVTRFNENSLWYAIDLHHGRKTLNRQSTLLTPSPVIDAVIFKKGDFVITLVDKKIICFDSRLQSQVHNDTTKLAPIVGSIDVDITQDNPPLSFLLLPEAKEDKCHVVAVFKDRKCSAWEILLTENLSKCNIKNYKIEEIPGSKVYPNDQDNQKLEELHMATAINPVGWSENIDKIGRDVLSTVNKEGFVSIFFTSIMEHTIKWNLKGSFLTGIKNCKFLTGSSVNKLAVVNESYKQLTIWDTKLGTLEYEEELAGDEVVKDIDWTSTDHHQSILAVGFKLHSILYTQLRFDYTNNTPTFAKIKEVDIGGQTTHEIGDSLWMKDGLLVIGSGNQFYISDKTLDPSTDMVTRKAIGTLEIVAKDLFHLTSALNGPLPLYHPQYLIQVMFSGRFDLVEKILAQLFKHLKELESGARSEISTGLGFDINQFVSSDGEVFDSSSTKTNNNKGGADVNDGTRYNSLANKNSKNNSKSMLFSHDHLFKDDTDIKFNKQMADIIVDKLQKYKLPYVTGHQQITLATTVNILAEIFTSYKDVLDVNGLRFFIGVKLFQINLTKENYRQQKYTKTITMRDISFAMHSDYKDLLFNFVNELSGLRIDWMNAKRYGISFWLENNKLVEVMEKIARNEFIKNQESHNGGKDPSLCSIYYLALKKKQVLLGLWRTAIGHPEQSKMIKFLNNDFRQARWKNAAMKNAFVLLGKHRYHDAAYFFLLSDSLKDCVNVIINKLNDLPLAIAVARCYEASDQGPVLKSILLKTILTDAITSNNRWDISWCFWLLGDKIRSIQALIKPIEAIITDVEYIGNCNNDTGGGDGSGTSNGSSNESFKLPNSATSHQINNLNNEDPVLLIMYDSLRMRQLDYFKGASNMDPTFEFQFIIKAASMYEKMGCDLISLYLVKNWQFFTVSNSTTASSDKKTKNKKKEIEGFHAIERVGSNESQAKNPVSLLDSFITDFSGGSGGSNTSNGNGNGVAVNGNGVVGNGNGGNSGYPTSADSGQKYANNKIQPPSSAFVEPDMSAFDFGF